MFVSDDNGIWHILWYIMFTDGRYVILQHDISMQIISYLMPTASEITMKDMDKSVDNKPQQNITKRRCSE